MPALLGLGFCRAGVGILSPEHSVRPQGNVYNVTNEDDEEMADDKEGHIDKLISDKGAIMEEGGEEKEEEEARIIKGKKPVRQPTKEEYDAHMRTHIPFRKWCPHCVKGKRKNDPRKIDREKEEQEVPTMSWDYIEQRGKDGKIIEEEDGRNKTIIGIDRENKWVSAIVVKKKGVDAYAVEAIGK